MVNQPKYTNCQVKRFAVTPASNCTITENLSPLDPKPETNE
jgi:hypothetical protein